MNEIICGDAYVVLPNLPHNSVDCIITSPPYWKLKDYNHHNQMGREPLMKDYINNLCNIFTLCKLVLKPTGTCFVNLGDTSYEKSLCGIPEQFMVEMLYRQWLLRNKIVWNKPNAKPQEALDKFVPSWEIIYFFTLHKKYYFKKQYEPVTQSTIERCKRKRNENAKYARDGKFKVKEYTQRGKRDVLHISTASEHKIPHLAMYPKKLVSVLLESGCPIGGTVLDPFVGSGTTAIVAKESGRRYIGIDIHPDNVNMAKKRLAAIAYQPPLLSV